MDNKIGVLIVDDHAITRAALALEIGRLADHWQVLGEATNASSAIQKINELKPQIIFVDHILKASDGLEIVYHASKDPGISVFVLTQSENPHILNMYWESAVKALISKSSDLGDLHQALSSFAEGKRFISENIRSILTTAPATLLTPREIEVVRHISDGRSNKEVADALGCTDHTIKSHKANIMSKLGFTTTVEVGVWASKNGLI